MPVNQLGNRFLLSGRNPEFIITQSREGLVVAEPVKDALITELRTRQIDVLIIDPFIRSHGAE